MVNPSDTALDPAQNLLRTVFGYPAFRPDQEEIIRAVLRGRDALVLMPTGGGKSLCYQIPAILRPGTGVVISPLIALMQDQVSALRQHGVAAAFLNSSLPYEEQQRIMAALCRGELDLLYLAPERLLSEEGGTLALLRGIEIALIAIDEAHCVSQWGHDFRQDYLGLDVLKEHFPGTPRLALTATADEATREEIVARLKLNGAERFISGFDRPNIRYTVRMKNGPGADLLAFLREREGQAGIVYCLSRRKVEATAERLRQAGFDALPYHAGLSARARRRCQERFQRTDGVIVVATIAFGMGIDKPDVRFVAHCDLPKSIEAYYQETGRAGRDGEPAEAWMTYGLQDVVRLRRMVDESEASEDHKRVQRTRLQSLVAWCEITRCRRTALLAYFGEDYPGPCGNCDNCLHPPKTFDGTEEAQKFLSCAVRARQRFGAAHLIDVLRGKETDKVLRHRHQNLSTFGIGSDLSARQWHAVVRQVVALGFARVDAERHGALVLTPRARPLLRGEQSIELREEVRLARPARARKERPAAWEIPAEDEPLWQALKACRMALADEARVPPYVIFHDATLREFVRTRPRSREAMLELHGVGQAKLERYGSAFLEVIATQADTKSGELPAQGA
ncbi:MAG: DNA helicase RecQ [Gammaproteobacteria bacterium]|nr:DNA helicase RecQ [Gammaproteobacteria bacterium]MYF66709.1 DNA helicase RecQ [Gammaproteobacteria bacterium]MYK36979.1 DNA helicase RecQ [Gammaproteobacteria bacterium]